MTRRVNSPYSKWHGQVFTFTPATNDQSYLVSAPPNSLVFHESELEEVEEQQETPKSAGEVILSIIQKALGLTYSEVAVRKLEAALKEEGYELKPISKP